MTSKLTITDERITSVIERLEHFSSNLKWIDVRGAQDMLTAADGLRELQERRKADSEPVAWKIHTPKTVVTYVETNTQSIENVRNGFGSKVEITPLYRHAQPAPVVPVEMNSDKAWGELKISAEDCQAWSEGWNACRAAMLNGEKS